jgi:3-methyladenine DNA glycosylase AlkD
MNSQEADNLAVVLAGYLAVGNVPESYAALKPVLDQRTPFRFLDRIASTAGSGPWTASITLLDRISVGGTEGGWVIIGNMLRQHYPSQPAAVFATCRRYMVAADTWYGADILGERVPGPALVGDFEHALPLLAPWRDDANRWVRRSVGVAVHYWAKRSRGDEALAPQAERLLSFLAPVFYEREMDAVKGLGWGLKTLGKHYPRLLIPWLMDRSGRPCRRLMLRKALTHLPDEQRDQILKAHGL